MRAVRGGEHEWLEVHLASGDVIRFLPFELWRALLHRRALAQYALLSCLLVVIDPRRSVMELPASLRMGVTLACVLLALISIMAIVAIAEMRTRGKAVLRMHASPVLFAGAALATLLAHVLSSQIAGQPAANVMQSLVLLVFYYVVLEVFAHFLLLAVIRRNLERKRTAAGSGGTSGAATGIGAAGPEEGGRFEIAGQVVDPTRIDRITAEGNYVHVFMTDRKMLLPGPFGALVDRLPSRLGLRVSRSNWIALRMVAGLRVAAEEMVLDLVNGEAVRVAKSRQKAVQSWLEEARQGAGAAISTQTG